MKTLIGKIISNKLNKTAIVTVNKYVKHKIYKKYIIMKKKYYVHDPFNLSNIDNLVEIGLVKPISKTKFYKIVKFLF